MDILERSHSIGILREDLIRQGLTLELVEDYSRISEMMELSGKDHLSPFTSPEFNDFTAGNCIWLCLHDADGPVVMGAARLEDLRGETLDRYWPRIFRRGYLDGGMQRIENVSPAISSVVQGRLVYFGDLFVAKRLRPSLVILQSFTAIGHLLCSLKWEPDWIYCFLRRRDAARGAAFQYGFSVVERQPYRWVGDPPEGRSNDECAAFLPARSLEGSVRSVIEVVQSGKGGPLSAEAIIERKGSSRTVGEAS
ncbi:hypothetical protein [Sulfitobacter sp.]|uniref:hypothetical protein n=1 Tax=Sulfitobacter sp. TaxID=1903071 RepID=UPI0030022D2B